MARGELAEWEENFCLPYYKGNWKDLSTVYLESQKLYARCTQNGGTKDLGGVCATTCGTQWAGLNLAFVTEPVRRISALRPRLERALEFYRPRRLAWILVVPDKWIAPGQHLAVEELLRERCFQLAMDGQAISAERLHLPGAAPLEMEASDSAEQWTSIASINAASWDVPVDWILPLLANSDFQAEARGWIGRLNGKAVAAVVTFPALSYTYCAWGATLPPYRKRGFGSYITRYAAAHSEADRPFFAVSSPRGLGTWLAAGFEWQERFRLYLAPV